MAKIVNLFNITKSFPCLFRKIYSKYIFDLLVIYIRFARRLLQNELVFLCFEVGGVNKIYYIMKRLNLY